MKAQVGMEFIVVFILALLIFVFLQIMVFRTSSSFNDQLVSNSAVKLTEDVQLLINYAGHSGGVNAEFILPNFLANGVNYTFYVVNTSVYTSWNGLSGAQSAVRQLSAFNVTNSTGSTSFILLPGKHFVRKTNEGVRVT